MNRVFAVAVVLATMLCASAPSWAYDKNGPRFYVPADVTLVPPVSPLFFLPGRVVIGASVNLVGGAQNSVYGVEAGTLWNYERENMVGLQVAGAVNIVKGMGGGIQAATLLNRNEGSFYGLQLSPFANVANDGVALQLSIFANKGVGELSGIQLGLYNTENDVPFGIQVGAYNNAFGDFTGLQIGLANMDGISEYSHAGQRYEGGKTYDVYTYSYNDGAQMTGLNLGLAFSMAGHMKGLQFGGVGNVADTLRGVQIGGFNWVEGHVIGLQFSGLNVAGPMHGTQVGPLNYAEEVHGLQLGWINVTGSLQGVQIGLINVAFKNAAFPVTVIVNAGF